MNLIIDGNAFMYVAASIVKNMLFKDKRVGEKYWVDDLMTEDGFLLKEASKNAYRSFTVKYLGSLTSLLPVIDSVNIVIDSKSWRKNYIRDNSPADAPVYKGHRKYDPHQYLFYEYFQEKILDELSFVNFSVTKTPGAEGDDIITRIVETNPTLDFCIWSTDLDFFQLLEAKKRSVILATPKMSKKFKNIFTVEGFGKKQTATFDIFNLSAESNGSNNEGVLKKFAEKGYEHSIVDPCGKFLEKILAGDDSDNIFRITPSMTKKKVEAILDIVLPDKPNLLKDIDDDIEAFVDYVYEKSKVVLKLTDETVLQTMRNNLSMNIRVIRLNSKFFPAEVRRGIDEGLAIGKTSRFNSYELRKIIKTVV